MKDRKEKTQKLDRPLFL